MSIISFHRGLITAAILFCLGYGAWELVGAAPGGRGGSVTLGAIFVLLALGLGYYLLRLNRFLGYPDERSGEDRG